MTNVLSDEDAQKLFNELAAANNDPIKVEQLMKTPEAVDTDVVDGGNPDAANKEVAEKEEPADKADDAPQDTIDAGKGKEENAPADKQPEDTSKDDKETVQEGDELTKLREQLEKLNKENHSLRSQVGRVPHVQRKLKEIDQKLEELAQKAASPSNHPSAAIQPKVLEKLKGIRETDPELADAIAAALQEASTGLAEDALNREKETLTLLRKQEADAYQAAQIERLLEMYPNAPEVVASPSWLEWKNKQSEDVLRLATSDNADSVALAFELYARDMKAKYPELSKSTEENKSATKQVSDADAAKAAQIEEERRRKQATAAKVDSPNAPGKVSLPDDPEALFKKFSEEIRKQRTG